MARQKLTETRLSTAEILERDTRRLREGVLSRVKYNICNLGELNRNKRVYEKAVFEKVLSDPDIKEKLEKRSLYAHAEHPEGMQSSTEKIAGVVTEIVVGENNVYAIMEVLNTPYGQICDSLLRAGCGLGTSTRAEGELEEVTNEGTGERHFRVVPESYKFVTVDWTADPSTYGAFPESVERDLTKIVKSAWESKKIDGQFATVMLETMKCTEAVSLCESITKDIKETTEIKTTNKAESPASAEDKNEMKPSIEYGSNETVSEAMIDADCLEFLRSEAKKDPMYEEFKKSQTTSEAFMSWLKDKIDTKMVAVIPESTTTASTSGTSTISKLTFGLIESKVNEAGPNTINLKDILKEFEKIEILTSTKISESLTVKERADVVFNVIKQLRETVAILEAEKATLLEIAQSDIGVLIRDYAKDAKDFNKKISILEQELNQTVAGSVKKLTETTQQIETEKVTLQNKLDEKIALIEKTALTETQKVYDAKFKELKETFDRELQEAKDFYNRKMKKLLVDVKVKEASLENELTPNHLALLESLSTEQQIEAKIDEIRIQIREGSFHSNEFKLGEPLNVNINEQITEEQSELQASLSQTLHLAKSLK